MGIELYLAFVAAAAVLIAIPGPNVAVIVANSISRGRLRNRLAGGFYFAAAVGLAGARRGS
jgi:homoserine/homoserine lactone efflux protein